MLSLVQYRQPAGNFKQYKTYLENFFQGKAQFVQKVTFEPSMDFKQSHYRS